MTESSFVRPKKPNPELTSRQVADFGKRLRELRKGCGLTQEELAEAAGLSTGQISHLERHRSNPATDKKPNPSLATLMALLDPLQLVSIEELLGPLPTTKFR